MTTRPTALNPEQKAWRYIRRNKKFVFSNLLLITSMNAEKLRKVLESYVEVGYIKRVDNSKSIMSSTYIVPQKLAIEPSVTADRIKRDSRVLQPLNKVTKVLEGKDEISFSDLLVNSKQSAGSLKGICRTLQEFKVLELKPQENQIRQNIQHSSFYIDAGRLKTLRDLFESKNVKELKEIIEAKKPIKKYQELPEYLPQILETITQNEVLKRDELRKYSKVPRAALKKWWHVLKNTGVIIDSMKETPQGRVTYILSANCAKRILVHLRNGAYVQDKELKHLWTQ